MTKAGKLYLPAVQQSGADQKAGKLYLPAVQQSGADQTLADARKKLEDWRKYYNEDRPHGAIGNKPPVSLMTPAGASSPPA